MLRIALFALQVKEDNHQTSKELVMDEAKENSEQVTDNVPNDEVRLKLVT